MTPNTLKHREQRVSFYQRNITAFSIGPAHGVAAASLHIRFKLELHGMTSLCLTFNA